MNIITTISYTEFDFNGLTKVKSYRFEKGSGGNTLSLVHVSNPLDVLFSNQSISDIQFDGIIYDDLNDFIRNKGVYPLYYLDNCVIGCGSFTFMDLGCFSFMDGENIG